MLFLATVLLLASFKYACSLWGDDLRSLRNWRASYGQDRIRVGFLEELTEDLAGLLIRVHRFLDLESDLEFAPHATRRRLNPSPPKSLPQEVERYLAAMYDDVHGLRDIPGTPGEPWLRRAERVLAVARIGAE